MVFPPFSFHIFSLHLFTKGNAAKKKDKVNALETIFIYSATRICHNDKQYLNTNEAFAKMKRKWSWEQFT